MISLPYGRTPLRLSADARHVEVLRARELPPAPPLDGLLDGALASPIGAAPLAQIVTPGMRVTVIVSDATRAEPRSALLSAIRRSLGTRSHELAWTIAIATGTHGPCREVAALGLDALPGARIINHDGHDPRDLVDLGVTARGTPVRVHRCVVDADVVIATGCIRPHYFAGFGAGVKAIFPGLGEAAAIRINHRLKTAAGSRAGIVDGNPCREDLVDAVSRVPATKYLLNGVIGPDGAIHAAVAGDIVDAFRAGADLARPWFTVRAKPAQLVIASDSLPVTATLYQAAKIAAAAAPLVAPGGTLVIAAECADGIGGLDVVNEAILRIGVLPRLAPGVKLALVSSLAPDEVAKTLVEYAAELPESTERTLVLPNASQLICEPLS